MAAAGKMLRGGCHLLALTGTTSAPRISHTEGRCLCEMRGAEVVPVSASKWQPPAAKRARWAPSHTHT